MVLKPIAGYEGIYSIREDGMVRAHDRLTSNGKLYKAKWLSQVKGSYGYLSVSLTLGGVRKMKKCHRLVAIAFIPNPLNLPEVNHLDEDKKNNYPSNLEWCTTAHNIEYSQAMSYIVKSPTGDKVEIFNMSKFCRDNNLTSAHLLNVYYGKAKQHKGWTGWVE